MHIKLNQAIIKEMCGTASFKKGDAFYRANKVTFENYSADGCEATVTGKEDFHVMIDKDGGGELRTTCSCPKLASIKNDCQHVAAVLLSIYEHQRQGTDPMISNQALAEGLLGLFQNETKRSSRHQLHFEDREVLDVMFRCKPVAIGNGQSMLGIEINIGPTHVQHIRSFLEHIDAASRMELSNSFMYDPQLHCFEAETDVVIQQLIQVTHDEKVYVETKPDKRTYERSDNTLLIPPSSWEQLVPLLSSAPYVGLTYHGNCYDEFHLSGTTPPLQFDFSEATNGDYELRIDGLERMLVLRPYKSVLSEGNLVRLEWEESERLSELKQLLEASDTKEIPIQQGQINYFLEKVVPGLKRIGTVQVSANMYRDLLKKPLTAKLYLDRVKNRLLAGLEFHYEGIVINPLEGETRTGPMLIRDVEKEKAILQLMDDSAFTKTEGGYFIHHEELEYTFLYHVVPKLEKLVQIYATTAVRNRILKKSPRPKIRVKSQKERTNWLEFKFEMDGVHEKHIREILLAMEEKRKYYRLANGALMSLEAREFAEIKRFLQAVPAQDEDLGEGFNVPIVRGLQLLDAAGDDVFTLEASFRQLMDSLRYPDRLTFEVPQHLAPVLRDYQKDGFRWMKSLASSGFGGILADDMGLGKTLQSIAFIQSELLNIRKKKLPVLIICPSSLTYNWLSEFTQFAPDIKVAIMDGNKAERITLQNDVMGKDVVITSYPLLRADISWYEKQIFHTAFFDEAQFFKNPATQTARAVKKIQADHHFALTGTPIENALEELWSIFHVVFPELFQGLKEYSNLSRKKIVRRIQPFLLRRTKAEVLSELPEKTMSQESVELLPDQKKLYAAYLAKLRHDTLKHLDKDTLQKNRIKILAGLTRLRQICCHPALFVDGYQGSAAKFKQLLQIVEESRLSGRRVLIFSQFTKMLGLIGKELMLQGRPYFYLDGQTPSEERMERCNRFNAGERDLFLISLKAGGTGLNLTGADTVILYDMWWNPAVEEQAADRAHRMGQKHTVQVIKLVARGTIEEKMNELQEKKRHLIEAVIDPKKKSSSTLTEADIREILMI